MENQLVLKGHVTQSPRQSKSPAGIPHCHFVLEHRSMQMEAQMQRQAYVRIEVVASGVEFQPITSELNAGSEVQVVGFIHRHEGKNQQPKLVLHAQQIERLS
nr:primosomal replication protein N [Algicola sagamiensis]